MLNQIPFAEAPCWANENNVFASNDDPTASISSLVGGIVNPPLATLGALDGVKRWETRYHGEHSVDRHSIESLIQEKFQSVHGAKIETCLPHLFSIRAAGESASGAVGIREMETQGGLLERYLDKPVELILSQITGNVVSRSCILEVGNLAAESIPVAVLLIAFLCDEAQRRCRSHAVFTGTQALRMALKRARVPYFTIQAADADRLGSERNQWGRYYNCDPQIMAVDVAAGLDTIRRRFWIERATPCSN
ncbi:MAG: thermostable hemolysin [Luminiphilus sp.]|jgi:hypothetical protein